LIVARTRKPAGFFMPNPVNNFFIMLLICLPAAADIPDNERLNFANAIAY